MVKCFDTRYQIMCSKVARVQRLEDMKVAGLFAGIGGFEVGLKRAGHSTVLFCEIAAPACAVLDRHFAGVDCHPDVTELNDLPADVELLVAGFPCQDLSQAGMTAGIDGKRSSLVHHVFRLLDHRPIPWLVLENVSFMLQLGRGKALRVIVDALEARGYRWAYRVVNSLAFVPQRRERVFLIATKTDVDPACVLLVDERVPVRSHTTLDKHAHGFYWTEGTRGLGWASDAVPTLKVGSAVGIPAPPAILMPNGRVITPDIRDAERLQGFPVDWTKPAEEVARRSVRWSLVGSAVTVQAAHWIGRRLSEPLEYYSGRDRELSPASRWPAAARFDGKKRWRVEISSFPVWLKREPLASFLKHEGNHLSARATRGFLARADASSLRFVEGFKDRVRAHLRNMDGAGPDMTEDLHPIAETTAGFRLMA
jgi:DNA (cytosine-5)-methyltransferase 1